GDDLDHLALNFLFGHGCVSMRPSQWPPPACEGRIVSPRDDRAKRPWSPAPERFLRPSRLPRDARGPPLPASLGCPGALPGRFTRPLSSDPKHSGVFRTYL